MATWEKVDGGLSPVFAIVDAAIIDADTVLAIVDTNVLRSTDGGDSFEVVPLPAGYEPSEIVGGAGKAVIRGFVDSEPALIASTDGGETWTDVTPEGYNGNGGSIAYLPSFDRFIICDSEDPVIWVSQDAVTWVDSPVVDMIGASIGTVGRNFVAENGDVAVMVAFTINPGFFWGIVTSEDGDTWTLKFYEETGGVQTGNSVGWNGNVFTVDVDIGTITNITSASGLVWDYDDYYNDGPAVDAVVAIGTDFISSSFESNTARKSEDDGVTWADDVIPDITYADLTAIAEGVLAWGEGIVFGDGATWALELADVTPGQIFRVVSAYGLAIAVGSDDTEEGTIWKRITEEPPTDVEVPPVIGLTVSAATTDILAAMLSVGAVTEESSLTVPLGLIIRQNPEGGQLVPIGTAVALVKSKGYVEVPDLEGKTAAQANAELLALELSVGPATTGFSDSIPYGSVMGQTPAKDTHVLHGSAVSYQISVPRSNFNVDRTVISQYQNSPTLLQLVHNMAEYLNKSVDLATFYQFVWNVDTAVGFGLDVWGKIVGVSRLLQIPGNDPIVGFDNASFPDDWYPMSEGRFALENEVTTAYELPDDAYRVLILTKALANIVTTTGPALNQLLRNMFPGRGRAFVRDLGNMAMQFVFNFRLTTVEYAILTQSGVLPHPAGVFYSVIVIPGGLFGFQGYTGALPFNYGVFNSRPT